MRTKTSLYVREGCSVLAIVNTMCFFSGVVSEALVFVNSFCECSRQKDVTSLSCGWTAIRRVKISALRFLMLFGQS